MDERVFRVDGFAQETKPEATSSGEFSSTAAAIPQLGTSPTAQKAIFAITAPQQLDDVFEVGDGYALIAVDERKVTSDADFEANKVQLKADAEKGKQIELREGFVKALRQSATIVTNERAIEQVSGG